MKFCYLILLTATLTLAAHAQKPTPTPKAANNPPRGVISGTVTSDDGQPLPDVEVRVSSLRFATDRLSVSPKTKPNGQFRAEGLPPGRYGVTVSAPGYVLMTGESAGPTTYRPGAVVDIRLTRGGVITGTLTESDGTPAMTVRVRALRVLDERGQAVREGYGNSDLTDDQGVYRIYGLRPGGYLIATGPAQDWSLPAPDGMPPFYYPTGPPETAQPIAIAYGQEVSGIDMQRRRISGHNISGVANVSFKPEWGLRAILTGNGILEREAEPELQNGSYVFVLEDVPDGVYELTLEASDRKRQADAPVQRVTVRGEDVTGLKFSLAEAGSLSGRVVLERNPALDKQPECADTGRVLVEEIELQSHRAEKKLPIISSYSYFGSESRELPDETGAFTISSLRPGQYRLTAQLPGENWYFRAINAPAKDLGREGIIIAAGAAYPDVTITAGNGAASLTGQVFAAHEGVAWPAQLFVYLVPAEKEAAPDVLRYAATKAGKDGAFAFANLAPGRYWLLAQPRAQSDTRPLFWDEKARTQLRHEAEAVRHEITLNSCQRVTNRRLRYEPAQ